MLAATLTKSLIAAIAVSALASAAPHAIEKLHKSHDANRTSCTAAPVAQIHPANRTDLVRLMHSFKPPKDALLTVLALPVPGFDISHPSTRKLFSGLVRMQRRPAEQ